MTFSSAYCLRAGLPEIRLQFPKCWLIAVALFTDVGAATQIPDITLDRHHRTSWQTGGYFVRDVRYFSKLPLSMENEKAHNRINDQNGLSFYFQ